MSGGQTRVLVTGGEYVGVLAAVRALRAAGYLPWVAVSTSGAYAARSRAAAGAVVVPDPMHDAGGFVQAVADAADRLSIAAVLPGTDGALIALGRNKNELPPGVALGPWSPEVVDRATQKELLRTLAAAAGVKTPLTFPLERAEVEARGPALEYPVVVKAVASATAVPGGGLPRFTSRVVESFVDLRLAFEALPGDRAIVQPYLSPARLSAICGVAWEGAIVCAEHQVAHRIWPPDCGVSALAETVPPDYELESRVARLLALVHWSGIFQAQFLDVDGERYLIDLNPRIYGSLALAVAAGLNLPAISADLLLDRRPAVGPYRVGVRFRAEEGDLRALATLFARGERWAALRELRPRRQTVHAVFSLSDPLPLLTSFRTTGSALARQTARLRPRLRFRRRDALLAPGHSRPVAGRVGEPASRSGVEEEVDYD
jgi:predicted ATP-grasp superfamily ATP-dependent carboligase